MDKLTKLASDHKGVFETLGLFNKALEMCVTDEEKSPEATIADLSKFFKENVIDHFKFEEISVFPKVLSIGIPQERQLIRELQHDHIDILGKIDDLRDLLINFDASRDEAKKKEAISLAKEIIKILLEHASKEDEKLFPALKNKGIDLSS